MPPQVVSVRNASKVAAALANEKCQRILDYLGKHKDATETQISKDLDIALSTVHYNMKVLSEAHLVMDDVYTYSAKGKEVTHYRLNKNPIVIVQEEESRYTDLLKAIIPAAVIAAGVAIIWKIAHTAPQTDMFYAESTRMVADDAAAGSTMMAKGAEVTQNAPPDMLPYFIAGALVTLVLSFALLAIYQWWNNRES
jgi:DNA-binding transcriptional ArsR family regulator